jgi:hypothetical protein
MNTETAKNKLADFTFIAGIGSEVAKEACLMSATAYLAGEPWGDHPVCACPVLTGLGIRINDGPWWSDNAERGEFVLKYAPLLIGTRGSVDVGRERADVFVKAALAVFAPHALDSAASALRLRGYTDHADKLADFARRLREHPSAELAREARASASAAAADAASAAAADAADASASAAAYASGYASGYASAASAAAAAAASAAAAAAAAGYAADASASAADASAADASAADAQAPFEARQKARAEARRGVRAVLLQLFDEAIAITDTQGETSQ